MGIFNRNKDNDAELLTILSEIRDNIKINNDDILKDLESKIADARYSNDEELGVWSNRVIELENMHNNLNGGVGELVKNYANLSNKLNDLIEIVDLQAKELKENYELISKLQSEQDQMVEVLNKYTGIIKTFMEDNPVEVTVDIPTENKTIRGYKSYGQINTEMIGGLTKDGKFINKRQRPHKYFKWDIHKLLKLKKLIPQTEKYSGQQALGKAIGLSAITTAELVYLIETGFFDQYFNEWEQMQMDKHFGNWKPSIENNPEKRKEKGYC